MTDMKTRRFTDQQIMLAAATIRVFLAEARFEWEIWVAPDQNGGSSSGTGS